RKILVDAPEQLLLVLVDGANRLRNDIARDRWDPLAVAAVRDEPVVRDAAQRAVDGRRARGKPREDRQQQPDRRVQARELLVVRERQVQMSALQVRPAVAL